MRLHRTGRPPLLQEDDLEIQRSGQQRLTRVDADEVTAVVEGTTGVTWFLGTVAGSVGDQQFDQRVRYTRTWAHIPDRGWQLLAAHVSPV